jgi:hypothetical protein
MNCYDTPYGPVELSIIPSEGDLLWILASTNYEQVQVRCLIVELIDMANKKRKKEWESFSNDFFRRVTETPLQKKIRTVLAEKD